MKRINLVSEFQKKTFVQIVESCLRERARSGDLVFEVIIWTHELSELLDLFPNHHKLDKESMIYKFFWSDTMENDRWGNEDNGEVELERLQEFYCHVKSIGLKEDASKDIIQAYNAILEICESALGNNNKIFFQADYFGY